MLERLGRLTQHTEGLLLLVILLLGALLAVLSPYFLTISNLVDLIESYSVTAVLALGVFVVLVAGGIDISFAATASVAQYVTAYVATAWGLPVVPCILLGLAVGLALGCLNAALIYYLRVTSIIITIATMSVYFALLMWVTGGRSIYALPDWWSIPQLAPWVISSLWLNCGCGAHGSHGSPGWKSVAIWYWSRSW